MRLASGWSEIAPKRALNVVGSNSGKSDNPDGLLLAIAGPKLPFAQTAMSCPVRALIAATSRANSATKKRMLRWYVEKRSTSGTPYRGR